MYQLAFTNSTQQPLDGFMIQFNKNSFGLTPSTQALAVGTVAPGQTAHTSLPLNQTQGLHNPAINPVLQVELSAVSFHTGCLVASGLAVWSRSCRPPQDALARRTLNEMTSHACWHAFCMWHSATCISMAACTAGPEGPHGMP